MIDLEAFVLIGGRSSRLGRDKAFVEIGGTTLAERAARTVEEAFSEIRVTYVAASESQFPLDAVAWLSRPVVADLRPGFGAWSGLHASLAYARSEWALVLACDYPFVTAEFLRFLIGWVSAEYDAVVPVQPDGRLQSLCGLYRVRTMLSEIEAVMDRGPGLPRLREFLDSERTRRIEADEYSAVGDVRKLFSNINTPDDLVRATDDVAK